MPLYIFWFLHQTTTYLLAQFGGQALYIFWFLHQTTTLLLILCLFLSCISFDSYIKPQLRLPQGCIYFSCISFDSYIKPQLSPSTPFFGTCCISFDSYIKPQRLGILGLMASRCISFDSYIKPQHASPDGVAASGCISFDSYIKPQRHAWRGEELGSCISFDSYIKPQLRRSSAHPRTVVYLLIPTSNHNLPREGEKHWKLYIFWFLHQTTTPILIWSSFPGCISFDSYIKPQLWIQVLCFLLVVYLLIPTSNHNIAFGVSSISSLYIFWFLHQTTTQHSWAALWVSCISFDSYIKPQRLGILDLMDSRCISFDSYIKPQPWRIH